MPETLRQFHERVNGFTCDSLPGEGGFTTRESLREKIGPEGELLPFFGSTVIWELDEAARQTLVERQELLYACCGSCLAAPLSPHTFHITLHDLVSSPDAAAIEAEAARTADHAAHVLTTLRHEGIAPLHLRSTAMFSMVSTSVVMGFAPETEADCAALMGLYERFHAVHPLSWGLTPHVTLAYYRPGEYGGDAKAALREAFRQSAAMSSVEIVLQPDRLRVSRFSDMNHYL